MKIKWLAAPFAFLALAATAMAQVHMSHPTPAPVVQPSAASLPTLHPVATMSIPPLALPSAMLQNQYIGKVSPGTKVPLSRLPRLPMKTALNTIVPGKGHHGGRFRPMAATGATITITPATSGANDCVTGGTVGDLFNVGCQLTIQATSIANWSSTDYYQYYVVPPNSTTATEIGGSAGGCTPTADPWASSAIPSCLGTSTILSQQGTYAFLVYDCGSNSTCTTAGSTSRVFVTAIYVNAGQVFTIQIFQDPFHTQQAYQFDTSRSSAAYVYLTNVTPSDKYVAYVVSTGTNVYCAYLTPGLATTGPPAPSPRPSGSPGSLLCNPSSSNITGVQAPGGSLSLTWQFASGLETGSYSVLVFDQTANDGAGETLGQVQVSLTSDSAAILTKGSATGANNPSPGPNNAAPLSSTILAWDSAADQSVGGITGSSQQIIPAGTYQWSLSNPEGHVMGTSSSVSVPSPDGTPAPYTFAFSGLTTAPGQYPSDVWIMELYDTVNKKVEESQAFQILGYHAQTEFIVGGTPSSEINFNQTGTPEEVTADLRITNDGNSVYGTAADSFGQGTGANAIEFTTGRYDSLNKSFTPPGNGPGSPFAGVTFTLPGCTGAYNSAGGCSTTVADSSGNSWTATAWCSVNPPSSLGLNSECVLALKPVNAGTVLAPGAYIDIASMDWYGTNTNSGWPCFSTPCFATTTVLPTHGLSWSYTNDLSAPVAWTPVSFGGYNSGLTLQGTTRFDYAGQRTMNGANCTGTPANVNTTQGQTPWVLAQLYESNFTRAAYQNSTPYAPAARCNVAAFYIVNQTTGGSAAQNELTGQYSGYPEIAIGFPSYFTTSQISVDSLSTSNWTKISCPSSFGIQYACFNGPTIASTKNATLYLDLPLSVPSFAFQELSVQAYSGDQVYFALTNDGSHESSIDGQYSIDSLGIGAYSLNANLMSAAFTPNTVGSGQSPTPFTLTFTNASSPGADPYADSVDALIIESPNSSTPWTVNTASITTSQSRSTWQYLGSFNPSGNVEDYWFGLCPSQYVQADGPPSATGHVIPLTAPYPALPSCSTAQESGALRANGASGSAENATMNLNLNNFNGTGSVAFNVYAHGANGGGWSALKPVTVTVSNESASAGFQSVGSSCPGTAVATNSLPTIPGSSACLVYQITNTSASASIGTVNITLPAFDINGLAANSWSLIGSPITQNIEVGTISGGVFKQGSGNAQFGCTVNASNTFNPTPGSTNGQIQVSGCTSFTHGQTLAVEFQANAPSTQANTYQFPSVLDPSGANIATGPAWIGDQEVQTQFAMGLSVTVAPLSNPGPGYSFPSQNCPQCAFSGLTIDFGGIASGGSVTALDVARATVIYSGSCTTGCSSWQLEVSASGDAKGISELSTSVDEANGSQSTTDGGANITYSAGVGYPTFWAMPTTPTQFASGPEQQLTKACNGSPSTGPWCFDTVQDYKVSVGTDTSGHFVTVVYTLIAN